MGAHWQLGECDGTRMRFLEADSTTFSELSFASHYVGRSEMLKWVKYFFPTFEFSWLGEEMEQK